MSDRAGSQPLEETLSPSDMESAQRMEELRQEHLLLDPRPPQESNSGVLNPMIHTGSRFWLAFLFFGAWALTFAAVWIYQMNWGIGIEGINRPVMWSLYILNFVYFIGIGHAGTFISAALRVLKIEWRRPISRAAEIVTVFALATAMTFPLVHLGRTWKFYWLLPYPNDRQLWPSYHSPLLWDVTAVLTYLTCSILFAWMSLLPDLAMARDHTMGWRHLFFEVFALGWRGTQREWANHTSALNIFSYCIIPVMFSVHTIVSWDFAMALQPSWHSTIFGPYFVVGALFSGTGAVIIALVLLRKFMHLEYYLRAEHFNGMGIFLLLLSLAWTYFYFNDVIVPWYGQTPAEKSILAILTGGRASLAFYLMLFSNAILPAVTLWSRKLRTSMPAILIVSLFVQVGMYLERYIIIPIGLSINEIPFSWGVYVLHLPEALITAGAFGFLIFMYLAFSRLFPFIPLWEVYEGQILHRLRRIGRAVVQTKAEPD